MSTTILPQVPETAQAPELTAAPYINFGAVLHAMEHAKVTKAHQSILMWVSKHANRLGLAWASHSRLARQTGYTRRYVIRVMQDLIRHGEVAEVFDVQGRRRYRVHVYDFTARRCTCEQAPERTCELSTQAPKSTCELSSGGVNFTAANPSPPNEIAAEEILEERKDPRAHAHETGADAPAEVTISPEVMAKFALRYSVEDWPPPRRAPDDHERSPDEPTSPPPQPPAQKPAGATISGCPRPSVPPASQGPSSKENQVMGACTDAGAPYRGSPLGGWRPTYRSAHTRCLRSHRGGSVGRTSRHRRQP